ncbi:MAG: hypothetical protein MR020_01470 [Lachnospiraceae bacterium]|nr:hypothetical protein [Lachnospiraceae bacterium]
MESIIPIITLVNFIISIIIAVVMHIKKRKAWIFLFFIMLPVLGEIIYFLPQLLLCIAKSGNYDRESLVKRLEVEQEHVMPELKKELNVIPISDAMAVSSNVEKRTLLLDQLKKNIFTNYKTILIAGTDSDSESVHYVAAAKMEVYRRRQNLVSVAKRAWEMNVDDPEKRKDYLQQMEAHIASGLLAEKEAAIYKKEYCEQIFEIQRQGKMTLSNEAYSSCLGYLVDLGQYEKAETFWKTIPPVNKTEKMYDTMLKMYFRRVDRTMFYQCLDELCASQISLSAEGLNMLRYWQERRF